MLDLKKLLVKLCQPATCTEVTLPFTPPSNGLMLALIRANAAGRFYVLLSNASPGIVDGYQTTGGYIAGTVFIQKGTTVSVTSSSNIVQSVYYFIPLVGGYCLAVFSRLSAIFRRLEVA